jgi:hypothetical protein
MKKPAAIPVITIAQDLDSGLWLLYAESYGMKLPAGYAGLPTEQEAEEKAARVRVMLAEQATRKPGKPEADLSDPVWAA